MSLEETFKSIKFDDGLGNEEILNFLSFSLLNDERKSIYYNAGCFSSFEEILYSVKYLKGSEGVVEHIIKLEGDRGVPIYCECGISYEPFSPSGFSIFLIPSIQFY